MHVQCTSYITLLTVYYVYLYVLVPWILGYITGVDGSVNGVIIALELSYGGFDDGLVLTSNTIILLRYMQMEQEYSTAVMHRNTYNEIYNIHCIVYNVH